MKTARKILYRFLLIGLIAFVCATGTAGHIISYGKTNKTHRSCHYDLNLKTPLKAIDGVIDGDSDGPYIRHKTITRTNKNVIHNAVSIIPGSKVKAIDGVIDGDSDGPYALKCKKIKLPVAKNTRKGAAKAEIYSINTLK